MYNAIVVFFFYEQFTTDCNSATNHKVLTPKQSKSPWAFMLKWPTLQQKINMLTKWYKQHGLGLYRKILHLSQP